MLGPSHVLRANALHVSGSDLPSFCSQQVTDPLGTNTRNPVQADQGTCPQEPFSPGAPSRVLSSQMIASQRGTGSTQCRRCHRAAFSFLDLYGYGQRIHDVFDYARIRWERTLVSSTRGRPQSHPRNQCPLPRQQGCQTPVTMIYYVPNQRTARRVAGIADNGQREDRTMKYELAVSSTKRSDFVDITSEVQDIVRKSGVDNGTCTIYVPHTTAGVMITENWDPSVKADLLGTLDKLVPWQANYRHMEGNAAAHIKASLLGSSETVLVEAGRLLLGRWQGIFLAEFDGPRDRRVLVQVIPDVGAG